MFGGFKVDSIYNRRADIHKHYAGNQQKGIVIPSGHSVIFAFTGSSGKRNGYEDCWTNEGIFQYFGEGQEGDMRWTGGNTAIRDHVQTGKELLLFEMLGQGMVRCMGRFIYAGHDEIPAKDRNNVERKAIAFKLIPMDLLDYADTSANQELPNDLSSLRQLALAKATTEGKSKTKGSVRNYIIRSAAVRKYVLARAKGVCECCHNKAPFVTKLGSPYLEPHHIHKLTDGGPDHPAHVGATCPNCHKEIHYGENGSTLNEKLKESVRNAEIEVEQKIP